MKKLIAPALLLACAMPLGACSTLAGAGIGDARAMFSFQQSHAPLRRAITQLAADAPALLVACGLAMRRFDA